MHRTSAVFLLLHVTLFWSSAAWAEEAVHEQARQHFERGMNLVEQEHWEAALEAFDESLRLYPTQTALHNRALCLGLMGRPVEAIQAYEDYQRQYGGSLSAERRAQVNSELVQLRRRIARVEVQVEGAPSATVLIDGTEVGQAPLSEPLAVNPGRHQISVQAEGRNPMSRWVDVGTGAEVSVVLAFEESESQPPIEESPVVEEPQPEPVEIAPIEPQTPPSDSRRGLRIGAYASTGVAVAALGTALGLFLWNRGQFESWEQDTAVLAEALSSSEPMFDIEDRVTDANDLSDQIDTVSVVSWVMLGLGSAATAAAVALYVLGFRSQASEQVSLHLSPGGLLLAAHW